MAHQGCRKWQRSFPVQPRNVLSPGHWSPEDEAEGVKWLRKSADQGNAAGEFWLGATYDSGAGVAKDTAEALRWYRKAGDQGYAAAQYNLGQAYNLGNGVEKDTAEAARWWQKAAEQGLAKAQYNLGLAYHDGMGVQKDNAQAYFWIALAATSLEQGFVKDHRDKAEALLTAAQLADVQERIRKWEEAHPATQIASLNSFPSVPQAQSQDHPQDQQQARTQDQGEAGIFNNELHIEIRVSDSIGVQGGAPELEEIRTGARLERQGENGCRD